MEMIWVGRAYRVAQLLHVIMLISQRKDVIEIAYIHILVNMT